MDITQINEIISSETVTQASPFSHDVEEYKSIYELIRNLDIDKKDFQDLEKKTKSIDKPLSKFIKAVIDIRKDKNNDKQMMMIADKSFKNEKLEHALFFYQIIADFNPQNIYALDLICVILKKLKADTEQQKAAFSKYLDQDLDDTHYLQELSKIHLDEGKKENAIIDLKKAIQRAIRKNNYQELKICSISLDTIAEANDKKYLINTLSRSIKTIEKEKVNTIFSDLWKRNTDNAEYSIAILKEILKNDPKNIKAKNSIVDSYRKLHTNSERCEFCLKTSGLLQEGKININDCIEKFERFVQIEEKTFVNHPTFGLGRIKSVDNKTVIIDFIDKRDHKMSIEMANKSLTILDKNNILVLKQFANREKLHQKFIDDPRWGLVVLIKSGFNTIKLIKGELVPEILNTSEFSKFHDEIKKIIKDDNYITAVSNKNDEFEICDTPISYEEKIYRQFRNESNIYGKIKITRLFLQTEGDQSSESFQNILQYFINFLKGKDTKEITKNYIVANLFLKELAKGKYKISDINNHIFLDDKDIFSKIPLNIETELYLDIQDSKIKKDYIDCIKENTENWKLILEDLFTKQPTTYIIELFNKNGEADFENRMKKKSVLLSKQNPDLFTFFLKTYQNYEDWKDIKLSEFDLISTMLDIVHLFNKTQNAKYVLQNLEEKMDKFIEKTKDQSILSVLYWSIDKNQGIDDISKVKLKKKIAKKCPDIENVQLNDNQQDFLPKKLLCTQSSFNRKQKEYDNLINFEIPKNNSDIAKARELGDLKENSEYQYAKDKQKILNANATAMQEEIARALIMKTEDIDTSRISYGCKVNLENADGTTSIFTIMGPWESNADENIISYNSPLGKKLYGHTTGENLDFNLNDTHYSFKVGEISSITID